MYVSVSVYVYIPSSDLTLGYIYSLILRSDAVEKKRNIEQHDCVWHGLYSFFTLCTCQECRVINECAVYAKDGALAEAPSAVQMGDRK